MFCTSVTVLLAHLLLFLRLVSLSAVTAMVLRHRFLSPDIVLSILTIVDVSVQSIHPPCPRSSSFSFSGCMFTWSSYIVNSLQLSTFWHFADIFTTPAPPVLIFDLVFPCHPHIHLKVPCNLLLISAHSSWLKPLSQPHNHCCPNYCSIHFVTILSTAV